MRTSKIVWMIEQRQKVKKWFKILCGSFTAHNMAHICAWYHHRKLKIHASAIYSSFFSHRDTCVRYNHANIVHICCLNETHLAPGFSVLCFWIVGCLRYLHPFEIFFCSFLSYSWLSTSTAEFGAVYALWPNCIQTYVTFRCRTMLAHHNILSCTRISPHIGLIAFSIAAN